MFLNKLQIILIVVIIPIGLIYLYTESQNASVKDLFIPGASVMRIDEVPIRVEIANSNNERIKGLSDRKDLKNVDGLLFVYPEAGYYSIWMKDMNFPIDIIWIGEDLKVVGIDKNIGPDTYPKSFRPPVPVKYILETNVRYSDTYDIHAGQSVILPPDYLDN